MTRKDYVLLAAALKGAYGEASSPHPHAAHDALGRHAGVTIAVVRLADALGRDNPRFDRERFLKAAGVQS